MNVNSLLLFRLSQLQSLNLIHITCCVNELIVTKFIFCLSIQLFFQNNQGGEETTVVDYIGFIGSPLDTTNMEDFKRVRLFKFTLTLVFQELKHVKQRSNLIWRRPSKN